MKRGMAESEGGMMSVAFRNGVYWKEQCKFCRNGRCCKYRESVELLQARLNVVELESKGCYGSLSFWCDYYAEDDVAVTDMIREHCESERKEP